MFKYILVTALLIATMVSGVRTEFKYDLKKVKAFALKAKAEYDTLTPEAQNVVKDKLREGFDKLAILGLEKDLIAAKIKEAADDEEFAKSLVEKAKAWAKEHPKKAAAAKKYLTGLAKKFSAAIHK